MVNIASALDQALRLAGFPIVGIFTPNLAIQATWSVDPTGLTAQQILDANAFIQAFNPTDPARLIADADAKTDALLAAVDDHVLVALAEELKKLLDPLAPGVLKPAEFRRNVVNRTKQLRRAKT